MKKVFLFLFSFVCVAVLQAQTYAVALSVDMTDLVLGGGMVSPTGVHVAGDLQVPAGYASNWDPGSTPLMQVPGTNTWGTVLMLPAGNYEYKFINGNSWGGDESVADPACGGAGGFGNNRTITVTGNMNYSVCFNSCSSCNGAPPPVSTVSLSVDFTDLLAGGGTISPLGVHITGSFQSEAGAPADWDPASTLLMQVAGTNTYSGTFTLPNGVYEYKFVNGNDWPDAENVTGSCGLPPFGNRALIVNGDADFEFCFNACTACLTVPAANGDSCVDAIVAAVGTNSVATLTANSAFAPDASKAKWFVLTPSLGGIYTAASCSQGVDSRVWVLNSACGAPINAIATNDDYCELSPGESELASSVSWYAMPGNTYYIVWDDRWEDTGFDFDLSFAAVTPGPGDICQNAITAVVGNNNVDDLTFPSAISDNATLAKWYSFTPTQTGIASVASCLQGVDTRVRIVTGNCYGPFNLITGSDDACSLTPGGEPLASEATWAIMAGMTYYIVWDDRWENTGFDFTLTFEALAEPSGDQCSDPIVAVLGNNTVDSLIGNSAFSAPATKAKWFVLTPTQSGIYTASSCEQGVVNTRVWVLNSTCGAPVNVLAADDDVCSFTEGPLNQAATVSWYSAAGDTCYIVWDDRWSASGFDFELTFVAATPGPGDICQTATTAVIGTNYVDALDFPSAFSPDAINAKWFVFTPTVSGQYQVKTCGEWVDTHGWVLTGTCDSLTTVAVNAAYCDLGIGISASTIHWQATAGTKYYIVWDDWWFDYDDFAFTLAHYMVGDNCLESSVAQLGDNNVNQLTYPSAFAPDAENARWYKFTPTVSGVYVASTCGQNVHTRGWVLTGTCLNNTIVTTSHEACMPEYNQYGSRLIWQATAGTKYYIVWDDYYSENGFVFNLSLSPFSFVDVKFQVDASQITVGPSGMYVGIYLEDDDGWIPLASEGNGIYSCTKTVLGGTMLRYLFYNSMDDGDYDYESPPPGCAPYDTVYGYNPRTYIVPNVNSEIPVVCYDLCSACPIVQTYPVTLTVDMAFNELMGNVTSPNGVHVAGSFQSLIGASGDWQPGETPLTNIPGTSKYTGIFELPSGNYEFKFLNGNDWGTDESVTDTVCGGAGGFGNNRFLEVNGGNVNIDVCFNYCVDCNTAITGTDDQMLDAAVAIRPNPATSMVYLEFGFAELTDVQIEVFNSLSQVVYQKSLAGASRLQHDVDVSAWPSGVYQVVVQTPSARVVKRLLVQTNQRF
jgi:hypothetical protein